MNVLLSSWDSQNEDGLSTQPMNLVDAAMGVLDRGSVNLESEFDVHYGLLTPEETVIVRAYSDDTDDQVLQEIKPKFVVMFEPDMDFVRRIEVGVMYLVYIGLLIDAIQVYKTSNPGLAVRVYHMVYSNSCEEHKYLAGIRKEKDSFQRLIKERGVSRI